MTKLQFSLRELLGLVLFVAIGITSLRLGGAAGVLVKLGFMAAVMWLTVIAVVARKRPQAFAIGFVIPSILYMLSLAYLGKSELNMYAGSLPTTACMPLAFEGLVKRVWVNTASGEELPDYDPTKSKDHLGDGSLMPGMGGMSGGYGASFQPKVTSSAKVDQTTFMTIAHVLWAVIFGYVGGKLAVYVYQRRSPDLGD